MSFRSISTITDPLWYQLAGGIASAGMTNGACGLMQGYAHRMRRDGVPGWVIVAFADGYPIGWVLQDPQDHMQVYVRPAWRREGVGTALVQRMWAAVGREIAGYESNDFVTELLAAARRPVIQREACDAVSA